jgi:hypothetical protein
MECIIGDYYQCPEGCVEGSKEAPSNIWWRSAKKVGEVELFVEDRLLKLLNGKVGMRKTIEASILTALGWHPNTQELYLVRAADVGDTGRATLIGLYRYNPTRLPEGMESHIAWQYFPVPT